MVKQGLVWALTLLACFSVLATEVEPPPPPHPPPPPPEVSLLAAFGDVEVGSSVTRGQADGLLFYFWCPASSEVACAAASVSDVQIAGSQEFAILNNGCAGYSVGRLPPGSQGPICGVTVEFTPTSPGNKSGQLTFYLNGSTVASYALPLTGKGLPAPTLPQTDSEDSCKGKGNSYINIDKLAYHEDIELVGLPFGLHYASDRLRPGVGFNPRNYGQGGWSFTVHHHYDQTAKVLYLGNGESRPLSSVAATTGFYVVDSSAREVYDFNAAGQHVRTRDLFSGATLFSFTYNVQGRILTVQDGFSNTTSLFYSSNTTTVTSPYGRVTTFGLNANDFLSTVANPQGRTHTITYDAKGYVTSVAKPGGQTSTVTYDSLGFVLRDQGAGGDFLAFSRLFNPSTTTQTVTMSSALGRSTVYRTSASASSSTHSVTDPTGEVRTSQSGKVGPGSSSSSRGVSGVFQRAADPRFGVMSPYESESTTSIAGTPIRLRRTESRVATLSNSQDPLSFPTYSVSTTLQDDSTRVFKTEYVRSTRQFTFTSPVGRLVRQTLNTNGQVATLQSGTQTQVQLAYDSRGRLSTVTQGARVWSYQYDSNGNVSRVSDPLGRLTQFQYNSSDRMTKMTLPNAQFVDFTYDHNGNLASLKPSTKPQHRFTYNLMELMATYVPPALTGSGATSYAYNLDRQLTSITQPGGQTIQMSYDSAGRRTAMSTPTSTASFAYIDGSDLMSSMQHAGVTTTFTYNGPILASEISSGGIVSSIRYTYNEDGTILSQAIRGASGSTGTTSFQYDKDGLVSRYGPQAVTRNNASLILSATHGQVVETLQRNSFGEVTREQVKVGTAIQSTRNLVRDSLGRVTQTTLDYKSASKVRQYAYDMAGRLVSTTDDNVLARSYKYDANGNRTEFKAGSTTRVGEYDAHDRLTKYGNNTYTYTPNGELKTKSVAQSGGGATLTSYEYDALGNLRSATVGSKNIVYRVDARGRRVGKLVNGSLVQGFIYQNQTQIVGELNAQGVLVKRFVYGQKPNVPDVMFYNGKQYRIISDHVGTPLRVVESTGTVLEEFNFDEFGRDLANKSTSVLPFGFAGGLYDRDLRLVRFGARDYDPETGRWVSKDPILFDNSITKNGRSITASDMPFLNSLRARQTGVLEPMETNLYGYSFADPVNFIDSDGKYGTILAIGAVALALAIWDYYNFVKQEPSVCGKIQNWFRKQLSPEARALFGIPGPSEQ